MNQRGLSVLVPCYTPPPNFLAESYGPLLVTVLRFGRLVRAQKGDFLPVLQLFGVIVGCGSQMALFLSQLDSCSLSL